MEMEKRPSERCNLELNRLIACDLAPELSVHLNIPPDEQDSVVDDIENAIDGVFELDGYAVATKLEEISKYSMDARCVEILDKASLLSSKHHRKLLERWVEQNNIKPKLKVGDKVIFFHGTKNVEGEISEIKESTAMYYIYCEQLGHVKKGCGTHAVLRSFEEIDV